MATYIRPKIKSRSKTSHEKVKLLPGMFDSNSMMDKIISNIFSQEFVDHPIMGRIPIQPHNITIIKKKEKLIGDWRSYLLHD